MEFKRAMCFVALGVCALSLQGCGESASKDPYAAESQKAVDEMNSRDNPLLKNLIEDFQKKGGCKAFRAVDFKARSERSAAVAEAVLVKAQASSLCSNDIRSGSCKQEMAFEAVDIMLFTAEKLPAVLTWKAEHEAWWTENFSTITAILQTMALPSMKVVSEAMPADATLKTIDMEWLKGELDKVNSATLDTLCPNTVLAAPEAAVTARRLESDLLV
jgi:hypothetical protein